MVVGTEEDPDVKSVFSLPVWASSVLTTCSSNDKTGEDFFKVADKPPELRCGPPQLSVTKIKLLEFAWFLSLKEIKTSPGRGWWLRSSDGEGPLSSSQSRDFLFLFSVGQDSNKITS